MPRHNLSYISRWQSSYIRRAQTLYFLDSQNQTVDRPCIKFDLHNTSIIIHTIFQKHVLSLELNNFLNGLFECESRENCEYKRKPISTFRYMRGMPIRTSLGSSALSLSPSLVSINTLLVYSTEEKSFL